MVTPLTPSAAPLAADLKDIFAAMREAAHTMPKDDEWYAEHLAQAIDDHLRSALDSFRNSIMGAFSDSMGPPDYANQESINRINTNGGTWTSQNDGYVVCTGFSAGTNQASVSVNGVQVFMGYITGANSRFSWLIRISKSNVVSIQSPGGTPSCYFIPPLTLEAEETD
jgi:hypothetical protein